MATVRSTLALLLFAHGLSYRELGNDLGYGKSWVQAVVTGKHQPPEETAVRIAQRVGVDHRLLAISQGWEYGAR